ncbi:MAG TPA: helix-turn-helix domain-containing protein [Firmicutes bacterium]|nr:helix-turn-helix domain-containing protein [Bacillota bacterium]
MNYDEHLTPEEASRYLRLSLDTVYRLIRQNEIEAIKEDRVWKIRRSDLEEFTEYQGEREEFPD